MGPPTNNSSNRSCDPCRQRKIKCDKANPCQQCVKSFHDCVFSESRRKKRHRLPLRRIEELESRLQQVESRVSQGGEPSQPPLQNTYRYLDPPHRAPGPGTGVRVTNDPRREAPPAPSPPVELTSRTGDDESAHTSRFIIDSEGVDFLGDSGDRAFLETCREKPNNWPDYALLTQNAPPILRMPDLLSPERIDFPNFPLPSRNLALRLVDAAFDSHSTLPIMDQAQFLSTLESTYALERRKCTAQQQKFIPLLYSILALGCFSLKPNVEWLERDATVEKGVEYLRLARQLVNLVACKDLITLQAVVVMNFCYIATSRSHLCYTYLCTTMTLATRMGLHQDYTAAYHNKDIFPWGLGKLSFYALRLLMSDTATCSGLPALMDEVNGEQDPPLPEDHEVARLFRGLYSIRARQNKRPLHGQQTSFDSDEVRPGILEASGEVEEHLNTWLRSLPDSYRAGVSEPARTLTRDRLHLAMGYAYRLGFVYRPALQLTLYGLDDHRDSDGGAHDQANTERNATIAILASQSIGLLCEAFLATDILTSMPILLPRMLFSSTITLLRTLLTLYARFRSQTLLQSVVANTLTLQKLAATNILAQTYFHALLSIISTLPREYAPIRGPVLQACDGTTTLLPGNGTHSPAPNKDINALVTDVFELSTSEHLSKATVEYFHRPEQTLDKSQTQPFTQMVADVHPKAAKSGVPMPFGSHMIHYTAPHQNGRPMYSVWTDIDRQAMPPPPPPSKMPQNDDDSGQQQQQQQSQDLLMLDLSAPLTEDLDMGFLEMNGSFTADVGQGFSFCDWL